MQLGMPENKQIYIKPSKIFKKMVRECCQKTLLDVAINSIYAVKMR